MDVITMTRELGKLIQKDQRYINYNTTKESNDNDQALQDKIGEFNLKRIDLNNEMGKAEKDTSRISVLDAEIKYLYGEIMANENMASFSTAKEEMDTLLHQINNIITLSVSGDDPDTIDPNPSCSGGCGSCGGCA